MDTEDQANVAEDNAVKVDNVEDDNAEEGNNAEEKGNAEGEGNADEHDEIDEEPDDKPDGEEDGENEDEPEDQDEIEDDNKDESEDEDEDEDEGEGDSEYEDEDEDEDEDENEIKEVDLDVEEACLPCVCDEEKQKEQADKDLLGTDIILQRKIKRAYYTLRTTDLENPNFLKEVFTPEAYHAFRNRRTSFGGNFWDVIQAGASDFDLPYGIYAPDPHAYNVFKPLFNVLIHDLHGCFTRDDIQPAHAWGNFRNLHSSDPLGKYVKSIRLRMSRNLVGFPFSPILSRNMFQEIEDKVVPVLKEMPGRLAGKYIPLEGMTKALKLRLRKHKMMPEKPKKEQPLSQAKVGRFWPTGRGIFYNKPAHNFFVWVGRSDHLTIVSTTSDQNIQDAYTRLMNGVLYLERELDFAHDDRLGYLTVDPADVGTTLKLSFHVHLPLLAKEGRLEDMVKENNLIMEEVSHGKKGKPGHFYISNKRRVGLCEYEVAMEFVQAIGKFIWQEEILEMGGDKKKKGDDDKSREERYSTEETDEGSSEEETSEYGTSEEGTTEEGSSEEHGEEGTSEEEDGKKGEGKEEESEEGEGAGESNKASSEESGEEDTDDKKTGGQQAQEEDADDEEDVKQGGEEEAPGEEDVKEGGEQEALGEEHVKQGGEQEAPGEDDG